MSDFNKSIIYLVQANPVLYNSSLANYKNGRVKEKIWNQISEGLQVEGTFSNAYYLCTVHVPF